MHALLRILTSISRQFVNLQSTLNSTQNYIVYFVLHMYKIAGY